MTEARVRSGEPTVAFLDPLHAAIREEIGRALPRGWKAVHAESRDPVHQVAAAAGSEVICVFATPVRAALIAQAPHLKLVHKLGAGIDNIDVDVCAARGIGVARLDGGNAPQVAEHTLLMMLAACRRLPELDRRTRAGEWLKEASRGTNRQIYQRCVGLVGFGAIGREVARRLLNFSAEVIYYDPRAATADDERALCVRRVELDELLAGADIVSLHLPLMPATRGLLDARRLALMKAGSILVNCARGGLVDEPALAAALREGRIAMAALDTFAQEPPTGNELLTLPNIVVSPHVAGVTLDNFASVLRAALVNIENYLQGRGLPPACAVVDPSRTPGT
jgi:phosphoglycerate dehydrogenase-like enzyme